HLVSLGTARVALGTEVAGVESGPDGVSALLRDVDSGESRRVNARYLVAADGAHSAVRSALGIPMRGLDNLANVVTALFRAALWDLVGERRHGIYSVTHPDAPGTFLPAGRDDRWLTGAFVDDAAQFTAERLQERIRIGAGVPDLDPRIERIGSF